MGIFLTSCMQINKYKEYEMPTSNNEENKEHKKMISIYKIDTSLEELKVEGKTPWDLLKAKVESYSNYNPKEHKLQTNFLKNFDRVAYKFRSKNTPSWIDYVNQFLAQTIDEGKQNSTLSFLLLVKPKNQDDDIFAITFGTSAYFVIQNYIDKEFGLEILSHIIEPHSKNVKSAKGQNVVGITQGQMSVYRQLHVLGDVNDFGKIFQELNVKIKKEALEKFGIETEKDFKNCCAKSSFQIRTSVPITTIEKYINGCISVRDLEAYPINSTRLLNKKKDKDLIRKIIAEAVKQTWKDVQRELKFDLCHKNFDDYIEAENYRIKYKKPEKDINYETTLNDLIEQFSINEENFKFFLEKAVITSSDPNGNQKTKGSVLEHLFLEYRDGDKKYFVLNGNVYKIENSFFDSLDKNILKLKNRNYFIEPAPYPEWCDSMDETGYNNSFKDKDGYIVLHKSLYKNLELCDVLNYKEDDLYLYFVKDGFAGTVRDLSYQIYNTAKLIENSINTDCELLEGFYTHFNTKLREHLSKEDFIKLFKDKHIKYVFTFRDKSNRRLKDNPADFASNVAKFALLDLDEKMRQISNGELKILQVKSGT